MALAGNAGSSTCDSCCAAACVSAGNCCCAASSPCNITRAPFGKTRDGKRVDIYTLRNVNGVEARICNYGGILVSFKAPTVMAIWAMSCWAMTIWTAI